MRVLSKIIASVSVALACKCVFGAVTVTASRDYVDRKSTLHPSSNEVEQVGYFLGTQTNKVLASKGYVDSKISSATPGDYYNVSNAAMNARGKSDLAVYSYAPFMFYSYNGVTNSPPIRMNYATIRYAGGGQATGWISEAEINGSYYFIYESLNGVEYLIKNGDEYSVGSGDTITISSDGKTITSIGNLAADIRRESTGIDFATGDRLATTSDIPAVVSAGLTQATNYTDHALGSFASTGEVARAATYGTPDRWTDATGCVWEAKWNVANVGLPDGVEYSWYGPDWITETDQGYYTRIGWYVYSNDLAPHFVGNDQNAMTLTLAWEYHDDTGNAYYVDTVFSRPLVTNLVGRVALTNDVPSVVAPSTNAASGTAADAKATGTALYTGFTEWEFSGLPAGVSVESISYSISSWYVILSDGSAGLWELPQTTLRLDGDESYGVSGVELLPSGFAATRHLVTPTKTSQLTNDGDGTNVFATVNIIDASNATFSNAVLSVGIGIDTNTVAAINALVDAGDGLPIGGATTVGALLLAIVAAIAALKRRVDDKASVDDLPYAMVTLDEWEFSGSGVTSGHVYSVIETEGDGYWSYSLADSGTEISVADVGFRVSAGDAIDFEDQGSPSVSIVATRLSAGIHLLDRAVNAVPVSSATGITLPEKIAGGKSRDFYVRLTVSAESAVTFAATDSGGDAVSWDSMGSPSGTFAIGTYLYRLTEVADGVFHAADITDGGSIDPAVLDEKLDASSAAPPFSESLTYLVGEYVTYGGVLYRCKTAVTVAGAWTGTSNWEVDDMTSPDATLDIMSDGRLRVVTVAGEDLWMQGYDLESTSAQVLKCEKVNLLKFPATTAEAFDSTVAYAVGDSVVYGGMVYKFTAAHSAGAWIGTDAAVDSVALTMPYVPVGKVGDFVLDVDNSANASVKMVAELSGLFTAFDVFVDKGRNLPDLLTFDGGEQCELYFTMTAFGTQAKPAWKVVKQVVEKQEAGS